MHCLVVGADGKGFIPRLKKEYGVERVVHWDGRARKMPKKLPRKVEVVMVFTGFVSHGMMYAVKKLARKNSIHVIFLKRGLVELENIKVFKGGGRNNRRKNAS